MSIFAGFLIIVIALFVYGLITGNKPSNNGNEKKRIRKQTPDEHLSSQIDRVNYPFVGNVTSELVSILENINSLLREGYSIAIEPDVLIKYPILVLHLPPNSSILITSATIECLEKKCVDLSVGFASKTALKALAEAKNKVFSVIYADQNYIDRLMLDASESLDQRIAAYIKEQSRNLINIKVITGDQDVFNIVKKHGLNVNIV